MLVCLSTHGLDFFSLLQQRHSSFEELSEATVSILPCGSTGSEELRERRLDLDLSHKAVTS